MKRHILMVIVLGLLMTFSLATSSFGAAKKIYEWKNATAGWVEYTGTKNTAMGAGSSSYHTTTFTVSARVEDMLQVTFNDTSLSWTIKEKPTTGNPPITAHLTHGKVTAFGSHPVKMTVSEVENLTDGSKTIPTYYHFFNNTTSPANITYGVTQEPSTNGTGGWFSAADLNTNFTTNGGGVHSGATWITDDNGFNLWCALNITEQTKPGTYRDSFTITVESILD